MGKWINIDDLPSDRVEWDDIFDAPSIDIVRCKECKNSTASVDNSLCCRWWHDNLGFWEEVKADDFCSYGQKGDENVETD